MFYKIAGRSESLLEAIVPPGFFFWKCSKSFKHLQHLAATFEQFENMITGIQFLIKNKHN